MARQTPGGWAEGGQDGLGVQEGQGWHRETAACIP